MVIHWQRELCLRLKLKGRVIVSRHGINGTLGGNIDSLRQYKREMNTSGTFRGIMYKWSDGNGEEFPRLSVKVRDELVAFRAGSELQVDENGVVGGGKHLRPKALHKLVQEKGRNVVFFDGRNSYEAEVGKFKGAVVTKAQTSPDFIHELESGKYDALKDKPVVTYCTGGVRCEILSVLMKNRGFKDVYQIDGGIVKYGETFKDDGLWEGSLYIFDNRMQHRFSDKSKDIGICSHCGTSTSNYINCANLACNKLVLVCEKCATTKDNEWCKKHSQTTIQTRRRVPRKAHPRVAS